MPPRNKLLVVTAVWGDWHITKYVDLNLPTLLAEGNFPALSGSCDITYLIYTARDDMLRLQDTQEVQALAQLARVEFLAIPEESLKNPLVAHHELWSEAADRAIREGSFILNMPPDVAWSNGSFAHVGRLLESGKKAIFMTYLRVESESFTGALQGRRDLASGTISVSGPQLVELSLRTLHPLMAAYLRESEHFPIHPEMMLWAVPNEGLLCRILAREMFIYEPEMVKLNSERLLATDIDTALMHVIDDSDDLFAVSLAPYSKEYDWYRWPRGADPFEVAQWWLEYDSWMNDIVAAAKVRWHFRPASQSAWRARERGADLFLRRAATTREGWRLFRAARTLACTTSAELIATAVQGGIMPAVARGRGGALVFLPVNNAFAECPRTAIEDLHTVAGERALGRLMRRHFVPRSEPGEPPSLADMLGSSGKADLVAGDGAVLHVAYGSNGLTVNGVHVLGAATDSGNNRIYLVEQLLAPVAHASGAQREALASGLRG